MKLAAALLALAFSSGLVAAEDCTFDQANQATVIAAVAKANPGGTKDAAKRRATWANKSDGTTTFMYGGCVDFGSVVTRSTAMTRARSKEQVFALARQLAKQFWNNDIVAANAASDALMSGINSGKYIAEPQAEGTTYSVDNEGYVQLYVRHEFKDGIDRVTIAWQGNF
jgi:hypothetical protein